jgi:hypothetical protein
VVLAHYAGCDATTRATDKQVQAGSEGEAGHWLPHTFHNQGRLGSTQGYFGSGNEGSFNASLSNHQINALPENESYQDAFTLSPILDCSNSISPSAGSNERLLQPYSLVNIPFSHDEALLAFDPNLQLTAHDVLPTSQQVISLDNQISLPGIQSRNGIHLPTTALQSDVSYSCTSTSQFNQIDPDNSWNSLPVIGNYNVPVPP